MVLPFAIQTVRQRKRVDSPNFVQAYVHTYFRKLKQLDRRGTSSEHLLPAEYVGREEYVPSLLNLPFPVPVPGYWVSVGPTRGCHSFSSSSTRYPKMTSHGSNT